MSSKRTPVIIGTALALVLLALFIYPKIKSGTDSYSGNLPCLAPNLPQIQHFHPQMRIIVDGGEEVIPANIGLSGSCHRPLHTHATDGVIHVESQVIKDYTLGQFFELWGKSIEREGYALQMTVDGQPSQEPGNLVLKDGQKIVLEYKSNRE